MTTTSRFPVAIVVIAFIIALGVGVLLPRFGVFGRRAGEGLDSPIASRLPSFEQLGPWLQHPLTADSLRGRIVVVVLWADTSPRALRVLPEVQAWHLAYSRYGVRVIGVHMPEFAFSADTAVAARFVGRLGLTFPIVSDPSYRVWGQLPRMLDRPAFYVADTSGRVVFQTGGERTADVDRAVRRAVSELRPNSGVPIDDLGAPPSPAPAAASPRAIYLGAARAEAGPLAGAQSGRTETFTAQFRFQEEGQVNVAYPVGRWTPNADGIVAARGGPENYIALRTTGAVWAVLAPPPVLAGKPARVWVLAGSGWIEPDRAGSDVRFDARGASYVDVTEPRLYSIAHCNAECTLKLSPDVAGVAYFSFLVESLSR